MGIIQFKPLSGDRIQELGETPRTIVRHEAITSMLKYVHNTDNINFDHYCFVAAIKKSDVSDYIFKIGSKIVNSHAAGCSHGTYEFYFNI